MAKAKLKLSELQVHKLHEGRRNIGSVLQEVKREALTGQALRDMKTLEEVMQGVDLVLISGQ